MAKDDTLNPDNWTSAGFEDGSALSFAPKAASPPPSPKDAVPVNPDDPAQVTKSLVPLMTKEAREKEDTETRGFTRQSQAYDNLVASSRDIPTWNEEQQRQKFSTDPVRAFGSIGSVFAMVAAAFTHRPMINALEGSAAAMQAIKDGDDKEYNRAFAAYKENVDLALKRHAMMQQEYQDAEKLGEAEMHMVAAKYDDQIYLKLASMGYNDKIAQMFDARIKGASALEKFKTEDMEYQLKKTAYDSMNADLDRTGLAKTNPNMYAAIKAEIGRRVWMGPNNEINEEMIKFVREGLTSGTPHTAQEEADFYNKLRLNATAGRQSQTAGIYQNAIAEAEQAVQSGEIDPKNRKQYDDYVAASINRQTAESKPVTANKAADIKARIGQYENSIDKIDSVIKTLDKYYGAAGIAGKLGRATERLGNLVGSNQTDREQMERDINYLRLEAPRLLLGTGGRPLSAEASKINSIIGGLEWGDMKANTLRDMRDIKALYQKMKADEAALLSPGATTGAPGSVPNAKTDNATFDALYPVVK